MRKRMYAGLLALGFASLSAAAQNAPAAETTEKILKIKPAGYWTINVPKEGQKAEKVKLPDGTDGVKLIPAGKVVQYYYCEPIKNLKEGDKIELKFKAKQAEGGSFSAGYYLYAYKKGVKGISFTNFVTQKLTPEMTGYTIRVPEIKTPADVRIALAAAGKDAEIGLIECKIIQKKEKPVEIPDF